MRRRATLFVLLVSLFLSSGCIYPLLHEMAADPGNRKDSFKLSQRKYTNAVRWGDVEEALRFVHPELREEFLSYEDAFDGIRVTDFEVGEVVYGSMQKTATVRVTYHAYSLQSMLEKEIKEVQQWERLTALNDWVVRPQLAGLVEQVSDLR